MKVRTTEGALLADRVPDSSHDPSHGLTEDEANSRCRIANAEAERLGIKTRYEVTED